MLYDRDYLLGLTDEERQQYKEVTGREFGTKKISGFGSVNNPSSYPKTMKFLKKRVLVMLIKSFFGIFGTLCLFWIKISSLGRTRTQGPISINDEVSVLTPHSFSSPSSERVMKWSLLLESK